MIVFSRYFADKSYQFFRAITLFSSIDCEQIKKKSAIKIRIYIKIVTAVDSIPHKNRVECTYQLSVNNYPSNPYWFYPINKNYITF